MTRVRACAAGYAFDAVARAREQVERPEGLVYRAGFLDEGEERELLVFVEGLDYRQVVLRGQAARRTTRHYGYTYDYESREIAPTEPIPAELLPLRDRSTALAELEPNRLAEALVTRYPPGAGIGWHRDAPMFGSKVVGVSLGSSCRIRFQRTTGGVRRVFDLELEPRSAYVLAGPARAAWQHSIPATKALRYSITFRTLRHGG